MLAGRRAQEVAARQKRSRENRRRIVTVWGLGWGSEIFLERSQREGQARKTSKQMQSSCCSIVFNGDKIQKKINISIC